MTKTKRKLYKIALRTAEGVRRSSGEYIWRKFDAMTYARKVKQQ